MGIYKLPKKEWTKDGRKYKYYWNEKDKNGKWHKRFSKAYKTKLDAMNAEREFLNSKVEFGGDMDMTFGTLTDQYIESQKNKVRRRTMETYLKRRRYFTDFENVKLKDMDGILIAPGFGQRGIEGKFAAIKYARENDIPCLGICLGMQCMVIEFARDVLGFKDANSTEMEPNTTHKVIDLMEEQKNVTNMGGSMRLGAYDCVLKQDSKVYAAYGKEHIQERHRHRFEFNNEYKAKFEEAGMKCTGENPETNLVEVVEIPNLKWFVGVQYHPEYNSTVVNPNPLFMSFVKAAIDNKKN